MLASYVVLMTLHKQFIINVQIEIGETKYKFRARPLVLHLHLQMHSLQENRQKTTLFMTVFLVVEDINNYYFLCHYGQVVTDSQSFWT
jgi:hypothetical protein